MARFVLETPLSFLESGLLSRRHLGGQTGKQGFRANTGQIQHRISPKQSALYKEVSQNPSLEEWLLDSRRSSRIYKLETHRGVSELHSNHLQRGWSQ